MWTKFDNVRFEPFVCALPEQVVTSVDIERELAPVYERFGLHEGRIELMTGIRERRFWPEGSVPSDGSTLAGRKALAAADVAADDIDFLLHTSVSRDFLEPATAAVVHHNLGLPDRAGFFDISNACLGFVSGILTMANMIELGQVRRGLIVAGESGGQLVRSTVRELLSNAKLTRNDLKRAFASLTIGAGAAAVVMSHAEVSASPHRLVGGVVRAATQHNDLCRGSADTGFAASAGMTMNTDAETLLVSGCDLAVETFREFSAASGWGVADIDRSFAHQVGLAHRDRLYDSIGLPVAKDFSTFPVLGNVGSASLPMTLALGLEARPPADGEQIVLMGIGSGLTAAMLGTAW
jgi:3-oxoacyl-[acyl-carrier-protein] synthase III